MKAIFFIDYFIRSKYKTDSYTYRKARLLVQTSFLTSLFSTFFLLQTSYFGMRYCQLAMLYNVVFFLVIPFLFRWRLSALTAANLYIFTGYIGVGVCSVAQNIVETSTIIWFALLPVVALMLSNKTIAWIWTGIAAFTVIILGIVYDMGWLRYNEAPAAYNTFLEVSNITGFVFIVFLLVLVFQRATDNSLKIVDEKNTKLEEALSRLKATQTQLIQAEKMASLGELTAGIAHEIQNPLNFINNFSDINTELITELEQEMQVANYAEMKQILSDLGNNLRTIYHHGKRADAIVKGMLQHSGQASGQKEPTNINALADEILHLSYRSFRSKNNSFTASLKTSYDPAIGHITVVPQEIGKVFLNLFNNAFYAINEKKMQMNGSFTPTVSVSTNTKKSHVEIVVQDNGTGIPSQAVDKIFQPFFTTKPTGEGTGLGLSLSYDIITKGHGGEINVKTKEGEGSTFIIRLPYPVI